MLIKLTLIKEDIVKKSTLISEKELLKRVAAEGIDPKKVCVIIPRWAESAPKKEAVKSALVSCDLIIRSDGSAVYLDGIMGVDSVSIASAHIKGEANPKNIDWDEYAKSLTSLPE